MEVIDKTYKQKIEDHAIKYFADLHIGMPPSMIATTISYFEFSLHKEGLEDEDEFDVTHSKLFSVPSGWISDLESIAFGIANIYGNKIIKLLETKKDKPCFSLAFVGYKHDVHASYVSLIKLFEFAKEAKKEYRKTLDSKLKPREKKEATDDFMYDWLEGLAQGLSPTALTGDDYTDINEYIKNTFHTQDDQRDCEVGILNFLKMVSKADKGTTNKEVMDKYFKKYGQQISDLLEKYEALEDAPMLIEWSKFSF